MSLLREAMEPVVKLTATQTTDGEGGYSRSWTAGTSFNAAIVKYEPKAHEIADREAISNSFTVYFPSTVTLNFHDVIRRTSDNATFRITSDGIKKSPASSTLGIATVRAERWNLPDAVN